MKKIIVIIGGWTRTNDEENKGLAIQYWNDENWSDDILFAKCFESEKVAEMNITMVMVQKAAFDFIKFETLYVKSI